MAHDWNEHYASDSIPWDTGVPAPELVELLESGRLRRGRALDIGCGTGTNVLHLAGAGYEAVGIDVAELALRRARAKPVPAGASVAFELRDVLAEGPPPGRFDLVFDRGCLHVFDAHSDRERFARHVARCLTPDGLWLSLLGSTEGPPRDFGPPRRSARDIVLAVEPALEVVELRSAPLEPGPGDSVKGWVLLARAREVPAQPSAGAHPV